MIGRLLLALAALMLVTGAVDPNDPFASARIVERPGARIPLKAAFVDANGRSTSLAEIGGGKPILVTPVQHECPNICGVTLAGLADAIDGQHALRPGRDFAVVALGIDPREGPAAARDDLARLTAQRGRPADWHPVMLTGSRQAISAVTDALGYRYTWDDRLRQYAHVSGTAVLTADGRLSSWLYGIAPGSEALGRALAQASQGQSGSVMEQLALLCFHYDPSTGRYSLAITKAVRIAGLLTVLGIAAIIALLARRRRAAG